MLYLDRFHRELPNAGGPYLARVYYEIRLFILAVDSEGPKLLLTQHPSERARVIPTRFVTDDRFEEGGSRLVRDHVMSLCRKCTHSGPSTLHLEDYMLIVGCLD